MAQKQAEPAKNMAAVPIKVEREFNDLLTRFRINDGRKQLVTDFSSLPKEKQQIVISTIKMEIRVDWNYSMKQYLDFVAAKRDEVDLPLQKKYQTASNRSYSDAFSAQIEKIGENETPKSATLTGVVFGKIRSHEDEWGINLKREKKGNNN